MRTDGPMRVNRVVLAIGRPLPVYVDQRTSSDRPAGPFGACHEPTKESGADLRRPWARAKIATFNWPRRVTARRALDGCLQSTVASSIRPPVDLPTLEQCESPGVW